MSRSLPAPLAACFGLASPSRMALNLLGRSMPPSLLAVGLLAVGCTDASAKSDDDKPWHVEKGEISFYADSLAGNLTANGEKFDPKQATCAHRTLPFGTTLKITIGEGDKAVSATCRVNDRGPYAKDRVLDVSSSLAETLGFKKQGHANATLTSVGPPPKKAKAADEASDKGPGESADMNAGKRSQVPAKKDAPQPADEDATTKKKGG